MKHPSLTTQEPSNSAPTNSAPRKQGHTKGGTDSKNDALTSSAFHLAKSLACEAGALIKKMRSENGLTISLKDSRELLTNADLAADELIRHRIKTAFPSHLIVTEESNPTAAAEGYAQGPVWVIDPIDGTVNYASQQLQVGVSIAFLIDGATQVGVVYAPFLNELYCAQRGGGALCNGLPIRPRQTTSLARALVATGFPYNKSDLSLILHRLSQTLRFTEDVRRLGAASLDTCWVACGRLDAYYESVSPWDIAAAALIAREAGATVGTISESARNATLPPDLQCEHFLVATREIFNELRSVLQ